LIDRPIRVSCLLYLGLVRRFFDLCCTSSASTATPDSIRSRPTLVTLANQRLVASGASCSRKLVCSIITSFSICSIDTWISFLVASCRLLSSLFVSFRHQTRQLTLFHSPRITFLAHNYIPTSVSASFVRHHEYIFVILIM
jgi:hypothetical protein